MRVATLVRHGVASSAFEIREAPEKRPGPDEVAIRVTAFGLNFADVMARLGIYKDAPPLPAVLGYEVSGSVSEVGENVRDLSVGDAVVAFTRFGGYAEQVVTLASACAKLPDNVPVEHAVAIPTQWSTAVYCAEDRVSLHPGDRVLVQSGAGGVGNVLVQLALNAGCEVFATAGSPDKIAFLNQLGVQHAIPYREVEFDDAVRAQGGSLDVVFDAIGGDYVKRGMKLLGAGGRFVGYGAASHAGETRNIFRTIRMALGFGFLHPIPLLMSSRSFLGVNMLAIADDRPAVMTRCLQRAVAAAASGELKIQMHGVYDVAELAEAHDALGGRKTIGKVAVRW
ncbi:MAG: NADPH:quinone reductase-like Zn-dependent oxidoreductase [Bradymonadia bacterium]|jgi:NADPH:quinone reductase-like Zn-dependent oxidoreductase